MKQNDIQEADIERLLSKIGENARISTMFRMKMWWRLRKKAKEMEPRRGFFVWQRALTGAVCTVFIFAGTGAFAYASPSVSNGTILYPLKRAIEEVEGKFQRTEEEKIVFHSRMMEKRIEETEHLAERGIEDTETIEMITNEFNQSIAGVDTLEEISRQEDTLRLIQKRLKKDQIEELAELKEGIPPPIFDKRRGAYNQMNERIREHFNFIETRIKRDAIPENYEKNMIRNPQRIMNPKTPFMPTNKIQLPVINPGAKPSGTSPFTSEPEQINKPVMEQPVQPFNSPKQQQMQPMTGEPQPQPQPQPQLQPQPQPQLQPQPLNQKQVNLKQDTLNKATVRTQNPVSKPR